MDDKNFEFNSFFNILFKYRLSKLPFDLKIFKLINSKTTLGVN